MSIFNIKVPIENRSPGLTWYYANREKAKEKAKKWNLEHPERRSKVHKEWLKKNFDYVAKYKKEYRVKNKEKIRIARRTRTIKEYGISVDDYNLLLASQNGMCAICCGSASEKRTFHIDHDHITGKVRGILCHSCNTTIGFVNEDIGRLNKIIDYIKKYK